MIPSGLQALMEASAVLQQQASQTAPGPQGQQPTVASQVMQQAQQVAQPPQMPQVQDIGKQAGLAAQLMAQRQQQQQQTAQNPEAIAQMAAQMLQQKGVASLPANMQFRDGGIIGYAGPDGSVVANPVADRDAPDFREPLFDRVQRELQELQSGEREALSPDIQAYLQRKQNMEQVGSVAERADQIRLQRGSIYASPEERARTAERFAQNPYSSSAPMANKEVREMYEGLGEQQRAIRGTQYASPEERAKTEQARKQLMFTPMSQFRERLQAGQDPTATADLTQEPRDTEQVQTEQLSPEERRRLSGVGGIPIRRTPPMEPSNIAYAGPDERFAPSLGIATRKQPDISAGGAPTVKEKPTPAADSGIAAALPLTQPAAQPSARPDYAKILEETPESAESIARRKELDRLRKERLGIAKGQEDLSARGIEALGRAKKDRDQLLESARSRDTYERLNALFMSMRSLGNEVGNTQRAIQAREEAAVSANLLHEESVLKLKQAQQARELGMKDQEIQLVQAAQADEQKAQELRRTDAKIKAELAKSAYEVDTREMTHARDRAHAAALKIAELKQQAQRAEDDRETRRIIGLQTRLTSAQDSLTRAKAQVDQQIKNSEAYKAIQPLEQMKSMGTKLTPEQEKQLSDFKAARARLEESALQRFYTQLDSISKELGLESPVPASQSTGNAIDFTKLPTK